MHGTDGVALVVLAGEERLQLQLGKVGDETREAGGDLARQGLVALLPGQLVEGLHIRQAALQAVDPVDVVLDPGQLGGHPTGGVGVVPQRGVGRLFL